MRRLAPALAVATLVAAVATALTSAQGRFRSGTEGVLVDVQVMAGGKPVAGLTASDFELKDSGVRQDVRVVSFADVPISLLLALDMSGSVEGERLDRLAKAAREAVSALRPGDQAAVLTFTDRVHLHADWTGDRASVLTRLTELKAKGWTALYDAIFSAVSLREQAAGRVVLLVFSDGVDTASWLDAAAAIESAALTHQQQEGGTSARDAWLHALNPPDFDPHRQGRDKSAWCAARRPDIDRIVRWLDGAEGEAFAARAGEVMNR